MRSRIAWMAWLLTVLVARTVAPAPLQAQETFCGITPQSARMIAVEIMNQSGYAFDSASAAYYVSVLASRLSPYYVVYFILEGRVVGEIEVDLCGRQGTPHPGIQYAPQSELQFADLLLEPDVAFAALKSRTGARAAFGSRVFPVGLTRTTGELESIDFWWMILDTAGEWHYMNRVGQPKLPTINPLQTPAPDSTTRR